MSKSFAETIEPLVLLTGGVQTAPERAECALADIGGRQQSICAARGTRLGAHGLSRYAK